MTASAERAVREEEVPESPETSPQAQTHAQRAKSVPSALPPALSLPLDGEPGSDSPSPREVVRAWLASCVASAKSRELDLIHGPPASIGAMHARHAQAAAHWKSPAPRNLRVVWGWLHTAAYALLLALMDAVFSPAGAVLAVLALLTLIYWS